MFVVTDKHSGISELRLIPLEIQENNGCEFLKDGKCPFMRQFRKGVKAQVLCQRGWDNMIRFGCVKKVGEKQDEAE